MPQMAWRSQSTWAEARKLGLLETTLKESKRSLGGHHLCQGDTVHAQDFVDQVTPTWFMLVNIQMYPLLMPQQSPMTSLLVDDLFVAFTWASISSMKSRPSLQ